MGVSELFSFSNHTHTHTHTQHGHPVLPAYRGTSLTRKRTPLGPYRKPMPRVLGVSQGCGRFLMGEVPL